MIGNSFKLKRKIFFLLIYYIKINFRYILSKVLLVFVYLKNYFFLNTNKNKINNKNTYVFFLYGGIGDILMVRNLINNLSNDNIILFLDSRFEFIKNYLKYNKKIIYKKNNKFKLLKDLRNSNLINATFISWSSSIEVMLLFLFSKCNYFGLIGSYKKILFKYKLINNNNINRYKIYESFINFEK